MADSWNEYFNTIKTRLNNRREGFEKIFNYLDTIKNPIIVETGCYREENNYEGDGCSTLLFDSYIDFNGGFFYSVDIDPNACELTKKNTKHAKVTESDSVEFLSALEGEIDLLYLDSYNIEDWRFDWPASAHHLKELFAVRNCLKKGTLIVVDDNISQNEIRLGKGRLIYEVMESLGIKPFLDSYQVAWIWDDSV
jgi:hypothetical protein